MEIALNLHFNFSKKKFLQITHILRWLFLTHGLDRTQSYCRFILFYYISRIWWYNHFAYMSFALIRHKSQIIYYFFIYLFFNNDVRNYYFWCVFDKLCCYMLARLQPLKRGKSYSYFNMPAFTTKE